MRRFWPVILFASVFVAGLATRTETEAQRSADRAPAAARAPVPLERAAPADDVPAPKSGAAATDSLWPNSGERWIYRFERKAAAEFGGKPWLSLKIGGRAAIESTDAPGLANHGANRFYLLSYEVDRLELQGATRNETRAFPSVRLEIDAAGKLRELRFASVREDRGEVTEEEADLLRDLTAQWLFFERNSRLGIAEAVFSSEGSAAKKRTVAKRIVRFAGRPEISKLDSAHEWVGGGEREARVERIDGVENFTLASASGDFVQSTSYRWVWTATEKTSARATLALGAPFTIEESAPTRGGSAEKVDPARIARDWPKLKSLDPHARLKLFRDAKRALDAGATELVSLILRDLKGKSTSSLEWRTGVGALAASANPAAASALLALYREPGRSAEEKLSILSGVAAGEGAPAPEWKATFETALENAPANPATASPPDATTVANFDPSRDFDPDAAIREASLYALGSSIRKETDPARRQELEGVLWREAKDARTEKAQIAALEAIGNSGSGDYLTYVKEQFAAGSPKVRAKAVAAVRFLAADLAKPVIDRGKLDPSPTVRKVAEWSEKFQTDPGE